VSSFPLGEVAVVVVQVPDQRAVVEGRPVRGRLPPADEGHLLSPAKVVEMHAEFPNRVPVQGPDGAAQRGEHANFELFLGFLGEIIVGGLFYESGKIVDNRHNWEQVAELRLAVLLTVRGDKKATWAAEGLPVGS